MTYRKLLFPLIIIFLIIIIWIIRDAALKNIKVSISGQTMGTTYHITYLQDQVKNYKPGIDSLLKAWNLSMSTFIPESEISYFNTHDTLVYRSKYFLPVLQKSKEVYEATGGAFDPTVMPLVDAWGFGPKNLPLPDSSQVDSLLQYVGFDKIRFDSLKVWKTRHGVQLDFSAIAKGYGVDVVGEYLESKGIQNFMVEIGGEITCKGKNDRGKPWSTGIEDPTVELSETRISAVLELNDRSIATSGNYRNFYVKNGRKYFHEISPFTGYPAEQDLLSASVIADQCITADGFATGFMVLGLEKSKRVLEKRKDLDAYFIYSGKNGELKTYRTEPLRNSLKKED